VTPVLDSTGRPVLVIGVMSNGAVGRIAADGTDLATVRVDP
jgi:hypothetical protein